MGCDWLFKWGMQATAGVSFSGILNYASANARWDATASTAHSWRAAIGSGFLFFCSDNRGLVQTVDRIHLDNSHRATDRQHAGLLEQLVRGSGSKSARVLFHKVDPFSRRNLTSISLILLSAGLCSRGNNGNYRAQPRDADLGT